MPRTHRTPTAADGLTRIGRLPTRPAPAFPRALFLAAVVFTLVSNAAFGAVVVSARGAAAAQAPALGPVAAPVSTVSVPVVAPAALRSIHLPAVSVVSVAALPVAAALPTSRPVVHPRRPRQRAAHGPRKAKQPVVARSTLEDALR